VENIRSIRPGYGLPPQYLEKVLGAKGQVVTSSVGPTDLGLNSSPGSSAVEMMSRLFSASSICVFRSPV